MRQEQLNSAYENLQMKKSSTSKSKRIIWLIIGIIVGIILVFLFLVFWVFKNHYNNPFTYPYIPVPKNTIRSTSFPELLGNVILDTNDTAVEYSVISRIEVINGDNLEC